MTRHSWSKPGPLSRMGSCAALLAADYDTGDDGKVRWLRRGSSCGGIFESDRSPSSKPKCRTSRCVDPDVEQILHNSSWDCHPADRSSDAGPSLRGLSSSKLTKTPGARRHVGLAFLPGVSASPTRCSKDAAKIYFWLKLSNTSGIRSGGGCARRRTPPPTSIPYKPRSGPC